MHVLLLEDTIDCSPDMLGTLGQRERGYDDRYRPI
jgi:hypothetical protein